MKKVLLTIALPLCLVMGQDQPELPGWGVYGGVVIANASGDSLDGAEAVNLPAFGISKGVMLGGLPMLVGAGIHGRGYHIDSDGMHVELKANYLDLWAQVPYPVGPLFLGLGVNFGAFVGGTQKLEAEFYGLEISEETDLESDALGADVGLNFGVSYPIGDTGAQVGALYVLGLGEPIEGINFNGLFLNAGYRF